ncbi:hypothetical protein ACF06X_34095 [Streptomyces sp. NPDC015346]|uniref:hypothetical protein n=1 Tax=Streptomyces sp. NPDC015346 TaxID=3364954 RepID=UPI0036F7C818
MKHISVYTRNPYRSPSVILAVAVLLAVAGCSSAEDTNKNPSSSATATSPTTPSTPSPDPTEQTKADVVGLYAEYWEEMEKAYARGSVKETDLSKYAAGLALVKAEKNVTSHSKAGRSTTGNVRVANSTVTKIDLSLKVPSATVTSCLDISKWDLIDRKTKKKVALPEGRRTQYVIVSTFERWPQGWRVITDEPQDQAC